MLQELDDEERKALDEFKAEQKARQAAEEERMRREEEELDKALEE